MTRNWAIVNQRTKFDKLETERYTKLSIPCFHHGRRPHSVTPKPHPALSPLQIDGGSIVDAARCECYTTAIINVNWRSEGDRWTNDVSEKTSICICARERYVLTAWFRLAKENGLDLVCGPFGFFLKGCLNGAENTIKAGMLWTSNADGRRHSPCHHATFIPHSLWDTAVNAQPSGGHDLLDALQKLRRRRRWQWRRCDAVQNRTEEPLRLRHTVRSTETWSWCNENDVSGLHDLSVWFLGSWNQQCMQGKLLLRSSQWVVERVLRGCRTRACTHISHSSSATLWTSNTPNRSISRKQTLRSWAASTVKKGATINLDNDMGTPKLSFSFASSSIAHTTEEKWEEKQEGISRIPAWREMYWKPLLHLLLVKRQLALLPGGVVSLA